MRPLVWFSNTVPYQSQLQYENLQKRAWKIQFSLGHWGLKKEAAGRNQLWKTLYKMVFALLALADARFILIKCRLYEKRFSLDSLSFLPEDYDKCEAMREMWKLHRRTQHWIGIDQKQAAKKRRINLVLESKKTFVVGDLLSSTLVMNWQLNCLEVYKTVENQTDYIFKQWEQGMMTSLVIIAISNLRVEEEAEEYLNGGKTVSDDDVWLRYSTYTK